MCGMYMHVCIYEIDQCLMCGMYMHVCIYEIDQCLMCGECMYIDLRKETGALRSHTLTH